MRILAVIGTRPEVIKTVPLVLKLKEMPGMEVVLCSTGQHKQVMEEALQIFGVIPDYNLEVMAENQSLSELSAKILLGLQKLIKEYKPNLMISQGDTATSLNTCLAAFYEKIDVVHIEAGLRTGNIYSPFPEEMSRRVTAMVSNINFAPTKRAEANLLREGIPKERIVLSGNTGVDALMWVRERIVMDDELQMHILKKYRFLNGNKKLVLVTAHRRENHGQGIIDICRAIKTLSENHDVQVVFPLHHNPNSKNVVLNELQNVPNIHLVEQIDHLSFVYMMEVSHFIISDSGGIQEEAPYLGKPVLVTRFSTERQEALEAGSSVLVGPVYESITKEANKLLNDDSYYKSRCLISKPFGDGGAVKRIIEHILKLKSMKEESILKEGSF